MLYTISLSRCSGDSSGDLIVTATDNAPDSSINDTAEITRDD